VLELTLTSSSVARSDGWVSHIENGGHMDVVPFFLGEGVGTKRQLIVEKLEVATYTFFFCPFFLKFLGFFPAVIVSILKIWLNKQRVSLI
jgi:hypothetical protein